MQNPNDELKKQILFSYKPEDDINKFKSQIKALEKNGQFDELKKQDSLGQNILHLVMGQQNKFVACCDALMKKPAIFAELLTQQDDDGDTVMHQLILFGRTEALKHLFSLKKKNNSIKDAVDVSMLIKNKKNQSPKDILASSNDDLVQLLQKTYGCKDSEYAIKRKLPELRKMLSVNYEEKEQYDEKKDNDERYVSIKNELDELNKNISFVGQEFDEAAKTLYCNLNKEYLTLLQCDNSDVNFRSFYESCGDLIDKNKPLLDAHAIGFFMRFLNNIAAFFGFRQAEKQEGDQQQQFYKLIDNRSFFKKGIAESGSEIHNQSELKK